MCTVLVTEVRISATKAVTIHKDANTWPKDIHTHMCTHAGTLATSHRYASPHTHTHTHLRAMRSATDAVLLQLLQKPIAVALAKCGHACRCCCSQVATCDAPSYAPQIPQYMQTYTHINKHTHTHTFATPMAPSIVHLLLHKRCGTNAVAYQQALMALVAATAIALRVTLSTLLQAFTIIYQCQ